MDNAMVTGRMSQEKKAAGNAVLERSGLNASQAINCMYDRLIAEQDVSFLRNALVTESDWESAAKFIDALAPESPLETRFDSMTRGEIKMDKARAKGWV